MPLYNQRIKNQKTSSFIQSANTKSKDFISLLFSCLTCLKVILLFFFTCPLFRCLSGLKRSLLFFLNRRFLIFILNLFLILILVNLFDMSLMLNLLIFLFYLVWTDVFFLRCFLDWLLFLNVRSVWLLVDILMGGL